MHENAHSENLEMTASTIKMLVEANLIIADRHEKFCGSGFPYYHCREGDCASLSEANQELIAQLQVKAKTLLGMV